MVKKGKVIIRHQVKDFERWKTIFEADDKRQRDAGLTSWALNRSVDDPNEAVVIFEAKDLEKAKKLTSDPALMELMKKAGVVDKPTILFVEEVERCTL